MSVNRDTKSFGGFSTSACVPGTSDKLSLSGVWGFSSAFGMSPGDGGTSSMAALQVRLLPVPASASSDKHAVSVAAAWDDVSDVNGAMLGAPRTLATASSTASATPPEAVASRPKSSSCFKGQRFEVLEWPI